MPPTTAGNSELPLPGAQPVEELDVKALASMVAERRGKTSLRQAAKEAGVSFSTLTRVENGAQPDLASFTRICGWLGVPPSQFFVPIAEKKQTAVDEFVFHLRNDPRLSTEAAKTIASTLKQMYDSLATTIDEPTSLVACHLRAATTLRPGVPARLASLLDDFNTGLHKMAEAGKL
jgi:transcriptional regulator with XRE-family HTH domain